MSSREFPDYGALPVAAQRQIDRACDRFETELKKGNAPRIEAYLANLSEPERSILLRELLNLECDFLIEQGNEPDLEQFCERLPNDSAIVQDVMAVLHQRTGSSTETSDQKTARPVATHGLHIRCPHCHNQIEILTDTPISDVTCSGCGSHISLLGEKETRSSDALSSVAHFELIECLGTGGFGTVWKARDTVLDRTVAVKIPRRGQLGPDEIEKFLREARTAAQLKHPNIVSVHEVGRHEGTIYIVSDLVRGVTLSDWNTVKQPMFIETAELCAKVATALHHAHDVGIVHRDLKPQNIMIDQDGQPHVMDFGLAKREAGEITMTIDGQVLGTPAYMSPEQARGEAHLADRRTDVYAIGVILFELLTGELPFRGNARMLVHQVIHDDAPKPRKLNGAVPRDLDTICVKCMEKASERRYATARQLADDLTRFVRHEPIQARPIGRIARSWRWCKRRPALAALIATVYLTTIVGAGVSTYFAVQAQWALAEQQRANEQANRGIYNIQLLRAQDTMWYDCAQSLDMLRDPDRCPLGQRDFTWSLLYQLSNRNRLTLKGNGASVSSDGRTIALATGDSVKLFDVAAGKERNSLSHANLRFVEFSPNGSILASTDVEGHTKLWHVATGSAFKNKDPSKYDFSPDGTVFASIPEKGVVTLEEVKTNRTLAVIKSPHGHDTVTREISRGTQGLKTELSRFVAFSPDSKLFAMVLNSISEGKDEIILWDIHLKKQRATLSGHYGRITSIVFSPDGQTLASRGLDGVIRIWDVKTGMLRAKIEVPQKVLRQDLRAPRGHSFLPRLVYSPDGLILASAGLDTAIRLWDVASGFEQAALAVHDSVGCFAFSPDGLSIVAGHIDGRISLWDVAAGMRLATLTGGKGSILTVNYLPSGKTICSVEAGPDPPNRYTRVDRTVCFRLWNSNTTAARDASAGVYDDVYSVAFSADGRFLATASVYGEVIVREVSTGKEVSALTKSQRFQTSKSVAISFLSDGKTLAISSGRSARFGFWDIGSNSISSMQEFEDKGGHLATFSQDGKTVAWVERDRTIRVWDLKTKTVPKALVPNLSDFQRPAGVSTIALSHTGAILASAHASAEFIRIWDVKVGRELGIVDLIDLFDQGPIQSVALSPDGKSLVLGGTDVLILNLGGFRDSSILDVHTANQTIRLGEHAADPSAIAFAPDGKTLATGGIDGSVRLWDPVTGAERAVLWDHRSQVRTVTFSNDGKWLASVDENGWVKLWEAFTGFPYTD